MRIARTNRPLITLALIVLASAAALFATGCGRDASDDSASGEAHAVAAAESGDAGAMTLSGEEQKKVETARSIAAEIEASPDDAEAILAKHGLTEESFEDLMYEIAGDARLSAAYGE